MVSWVAKNLCDQSRDMYIIFEGFLQIDQLGLTSVAGNIAARRKSADDHKQGRKLSRRDAIGVASGDGER